MVDPASVKRGSGRTRDALSALPPNSFYAVASHSMKAEADRMLTELYPHALDGRRVIIMHGRGEHLWEIYSATTYPVFLDHSCMEIIAPEPLERLAAHNNRHRK